MTTYTPEQIENRRRASREWHQRRHQLGLCHVAACGNDVPVNPQTGRLFWKCRTCRIKAAEADAKRQPSVRTREVKDRLRRGFSMTQVAEYFGVEVAMIERALAAHGRRNQIATGVGTAKFMPLQEQKMGETLPPGMGQSA
jgi:hypothetical protein